MSEELVGVISLEENDPFRRRRPIKMKSILVSYDSFVILITLGLFIMFNFLPPFERPFDITDKSISHPQLNDFVPILWVGIFAIVAPLILTLVIFKWKPILLLLFAQQYLMGGLFSLLLTEMIKVTAGRLRPDFLHRCKPFNGVCTGDPRTVAEGRKSFVSGHASTSFYIVTYLVIWMWLEGWSKLGIRAGIRSSSGIVLFFTFTPFMLCAYVAISRTQVTFINKQYVHHPEDVLAGSILGIVVAVVVLLFHYRQVQN